MHLLQNTLATPERNLAFDDALIVAADSHGSDTSGQNPNEREVLRLWEAQSPFIVLGRSSKIDDEVDRQKANAAGIPVLRRISGGATILAAPGCMFYTVLLSLETKPHLRMLDEAHRFVMGRILTAVQKFKPSAELLGTCDLVIGERKTSGNALRVGRSWLLYHGTLLLDMDLSLVAEFLKHPPREPDYRSGRSHSEFLTNLNIPTEELQQSLTEVWEAEVGEHCQLPTQELVQQLVDEKYGLESWNAQR